MRTTRISTNWKRWAVIGVLVTAAVQQVGVPQANGQQLLQRPVNSTVSTIQTPFNSELVYDEATSPRRPAAASQSTTSGSPFGSYRPTPVEPIETSVPTHSQSATSLMQPRIRPVKVGTWTESEQIQHREIEQQFAPVNPVNVAPPTLVDLSAAGETIPSAPAYSARRAFVFSSAYHPWTGPEALQDSLPYAAQCCGDEWTKTCKPGDCCNQFGIFPTPFARARCRTCEGGCK